MLEYTSIVPAAGASSRMGRPKLLLPLDGRPLILSTIDALCSGGCSQIVLVTHPGDEDLRALFQRTSVTLVINPRPTDGMLSSIQCGLSTPEASRASATLICPADLPRLAAGTVRSVISEHRENRSSLVVPVHSGRRGHPLLIDRSLSSAVENLDPAIGLRQLVRDPQRRVTEVPVDDAGCRLDVDYPDDYRRIRDLSERSSGGPGRTDP